MIRLITSLCLICIISVVSGCKTTPTDDPITPQPADPNKYLITPDGKTLPKDEIPIQPLANEDKPSPHVPVAQDPHGHVKVDTQAETRYVEETKEASDVVVTRRETASEIETVYVRIELKNFDDETVLGAIKDRIFVTSRNNNYTCTQEKQINRKHIILKVATALPGPISLHQTIQNSLEGFAVRIEQRSDSELIIQPK